MAHIPRASDAAYPDRVADEPSAGLGEVVPFAMRDLDRAIARGLERHGHLLSAGERAVVGRLQRCGPAARSLYARLFARKDRFLALSALRYDEVGDAAAATATLVDAGLARRSTGLATEAELLGLHTVAELRQVCRALGLPGQGRRAVVEQRLLAGPSPRSLLLRPAVRLRHRRLVRRLCRAWLVDHAGDLNQLVLARMEILRLPDHPVTGGPGLHPHRRALLAYESALARWGRRDVVVAEEAEVALLALQCMGPPDPARARFTPLPFAQRIVLHAARDRERARDLAGALALYRALVAALEQLGMPPPPELIRRMALCLDRLGQPGEGATCCAVALDEVDLVAARGLARTGRRLARRAKQPWRPLPALHPPALRELTLDGAGTEGPRPLWSVAGRHLPAEAAVAAALRGAGREVLRAENAPWTSLFALLMWEVLFAPVAGMLPGPGMHRPLDLGLPGFGDRRQGPLGAVLSAVRAGAAAERLERALEEHRGEAIAGLHWRDGLEDELRAIVAALPGPALAGILAAYARDWRRARSGMPDLLLLPGPVLRVPGLFPGRLPDSAVFIEVKGPSDSLRDGQRVWLDRLHGLGLVAEVWAVAPSAAPQLG